MARGGESPGVLAKSSSSSYTKPQISKAVWGFFFSAPKKPAHAALSTERRVARRQRKGRREGGLFASLGAVSRRGIRSRWCRFRGGVRGTTPGPFGAQRHLRHDVSNLSLTLRTSW